MKSKPSMNIQQNEIENQISSFDLMVINEQLFSILEENNSIKDNCQFIVEIISRYCALDSFILITPDEDNISQISINYCFISHDEDYQVTKLLHNLSYETAHINSQEILTDEIQKFLDVNNYSILVFPLVYKHQYWGNLLIKLKNETGEKSDHHKILKITAKFLAIFLYQSHIEKTIKNNQNYTEILSYMHHEIRTPIASIIGFTRMLKKQIYGELNNKQIEYTSAIYESGKYLLNLVNDLLDISKLEAHKEELVIKKVNIQKLCEYCLSLIEEKVKEQNLQIILDMEDSLNYCYGDEQKIKQILINLLSNAVKFTEFGSVTLRVRMKDNQVNFSVIDTGIGIDEQLHHKLFQPFSQIKTHLHHKNKGTGLGLVIAQELAKLHHGDLTFKSEKNQGSSFTLTIPQPLTETVEEK